MSSNYWSFGRERMRRRRFIKGTAALVAGGAALTIAGCGGGSSSSAPQKDKSGLLSKPEDLTSKAVRGGTLPAHFVADNPSFDGMTSLSAQTSLHNEYGYARMVKFRLFNTTKGEKLDGSVDPYAAESWEVSPDGMQYTFRLQANGGLDPRPPTNGRVLDANDVVFSWNRFKATHRSRGLLSNDVNKNAAVVSVSATDARTVVFKLAYPSVSLLPALAFNFFFMIQPKEADGGFDPRTTMRGSGPWMLSEYQPSVGFKYQRNPGFYNKERPYLDGIDGPIILEYAQGLAQLKAGRLFTYTVRQEDIIQTKQDATSLRLLANSSFPFNAGQIVFFSYKQGSPFLDERLRKALSLLTDRDLFIETMYNVSSFEKAGLPVQQRWATILPPGEDASLLDPRSSAFGENSKFYKYDPAEAKKLVQAVGRGVIEQPFTSVQGNEFGPDHKREAEILRGMWEAGGDFKLKANLVDYTTVFLPRYSISGANRDMEAGGVAMAGVAAFPEPDLLLGEWYIPGGTYYKFENGPSDPQWENLLKAQRTELDAKKRLSLLHDIQKYHAGKMYTIHRPGAALGFNVSWPWAANMGVFASRGDGASTTTPAIWIDKTKQ